MANMQKMGDTLARTRLAAGVPAQRPRAASTRPITPAQRPPRPTEVTGVTGQSETSDDEQAQKQRADVLRAKIAAMLPPHSAHIDDTSAPRRLLCATCGGAGWVRAGEISGDHAWRVELAPCPDASHDRDRFNRARRLSDISDPLLRLAFDGPQGYDASDNAEALAATQAWSTDDGQREYPWLLLYGLMGTGKTHLLAAAFNALVAHGRYPLYALTPSLLDAVRDALDSDRPQDYGARFRAVQQAPILLLDDLGAEKRTAWTDETIFKLLDYRYRQQLPTVVATNLLPDDLEERIASRLQDRHIGRVVLMRGDDRRKSGGKTTAKGT
jgi:DNA replication protein DnaC